MNLLADEYANEFFTIIGVCDGGDVDAWRRYITEHQMLRTSAWTRSSE